MSEPALPESLRRELSATVALFLWDDDFAGYAAWFRSLPADQQLFVRSLAAAQVPAQLHATFAPGTPP